MDAADLSLGTQSFPVLREDRQVYIDKTALIFKFARLRGRFFLARPRRFGKSLLVSTLASLFKHGVRDFQGLAIEKRWTDKTYDVVHLDFSMAFDHGSAENFRTSFYEMLACCLEDLGFEPSDSSTGFIYEFAEWLHDRPDDSLVLLIDEYDAPLTRVLKDRALFPGVQDVLRQFFTVLKSCDHAFRFVFVTGITRFDGAGVFSGYNILQDITLDPGYGSLLGFTEAELAQYFPDFLEDAARVHGITVPQLLLRLRAYYGGYSFDRKGISCVYSPWAVLKFFNDDAHDFENYWFQSCNNTYELMDFLRDRRLEAPWAFLETVSVDRYRALSSAPYAKLDVNVLLQQAGYLTIRSVDAGGGLRLGYPNRDVAASMACLYLQIMMGDDDFCPLGFLTLMLQGKAPEAVDFINKALSSLDCDGYPIRDEAAFRSFVRVFLVAGTRLPQVEVHFAQDRDGLEADAGDYRWVFELKFARKGEDAAALCRQASDQIWKRKYGETPHGKHLIRVAMVFEEAARQVTAWKAL